MFDLNKNILNWKDAIKNNDSFTNENIDELENHLFEQIENLKISGLNDEEAFWVAQKRIGSLKILVPEYEKVNNLAAFRKRIFWMLNGIVCMMIFAFFISSTSYLFIYLSSVFKIDLMKAIYAGYIMNEIVFFLVAGGILWVITDRKNNRLTEMKSAFINNLLFGKGIKLFYGSLIAVLVLFFFLHYFRGDLNLYLIRSDSYGDYKEFMKTIPMALMVFNSLVMMIIYHISFKVNKKVYITAD